MWPGLGVVCVNTDTNLGNRFSLDILHKKEADFGFFVLCKKNPGEGCEKEMQVYKQILYW